MLPKYNVVQTFRNPILLRVFTRSLIMICRKCVHFHFNMFNTTISNVLFLSRVANKGRYAPNPHNSTLRFTVTLVKLKRVGPMFILFTLLFHKITVND